MSVGGVGSLIRNNIFDGNVESAGGFGAAIGGNVSSPIIDSNIFRNNSADTQHLSGVIGFINGSSPTISNNLFVNNPTRAINLVLPSGNNPIIFNNTFVNNDVAMKLSTFSPITARNNLLFGNTIGLLSDPSAPLTFENNLVYNNATNYSGIADQTGIAGNISANPLFVNGASNFHLLPGSPAIDAGSNLGAPDHDLDGRFRPRGSSTDIGAYEVPEPSGAVLLLPLLSQFIRRRR
jgi:serine protease